MRKVLVIYASLLALNAGAWALALWAFWSHPILLGTALLAYTFGLRHAVDADHISAIDNVTRKLMQERKRPVSIGLFFSLGHSTVVVALSVAIAIAAGLVKDHLPALQRNGELVGTSISAGFLLIIAAINFVVLVGVADAFGKARRGQAYEDRTVDAMLEQRGLMGRCFRPLLRIVDCSWKMYPIGLLFGLGFDTASEVALLGIAAVEAGIFAHRLALNGGVWTMIRGANDNFGTLGFIIVGVFAASWVLSIAVYKLMRYDELTAA